MTNNILLSRGLWTGLNGLRIRLTNLFLSCFSLLFLQVLVFCAVFLLPQSKMKMRTLSCSSSTLKTSQRPPKYRRWGQVQQPLPQEALGMRMGCHQDQHLQSKQQVWVEATGGREVEVSFPSPYMKSSNSLKIQQVKQQQFWIPSSCNWLLSKWNSNYYKLRFKFLCLKQIYAAAKDTFLQLPKY